MGFFSYRFDTIRCNELNSTSQTNRVVFIIFDFLQVVYNRNQKSTITLNRLAVCFYIFKKQFT